MLQPILLLIPTDSKSFLCQKYKQRGWTEQKMEAEREKTGKCFAKQYT